MFIGFGYLMTFLKEFGIGAIGFTMMITVVGMQWSLFTELFFYQLYHNQHEAYSFGIYQMIEALYAVAAVLITFGGIIGKVTPLQLLILTLIELIFYSFNNQIFLVGALEVADAGGTIIIHMFGAYFGLSVSYILGHNNEVPKQGYVPDMFAFIGTLFLWIYWPSFVGGALEPGSDDQQKAVIFTILALASSSTVAFSLSSILDENNEFRPVDLQNASLAGGVAIGAVANLTLNPIVACIIGCIAGAVSTFGFAKLQSIIENKFGLHDTCGIHNLHGMPSIIGGIFSVIGAAHKQNLDSESEIYESHPHNAWGYQLAAILITLGFSILTGTLTGYILKLVDGKSTQPRFKDNASWKVESE